MSGTPSTLTCSSLPTNQIMVRTSHARGRVIHIYDQNRHATLASPMMQQPTISFTLTVTVGDMYIQILLLNAKLSYLAMNSSPHFSSVSNTLEF